MQHDDQAAEALRTGFGDAVTGPHRDAGWPDTADPYLLVEAGRWAEVARECRDNPALAFDYLNDLTVVDYLPPADKRKAEGIGEPRLEVVCQLSSLARKRRLTLKTRLPRWKDEATGELPEIGSLAPLWRTAEWHECEAFDLLGVRFVGHPNLRRILCPEDWVGHPLRKDYQMPLEYHGIRGR